MQRLSLFDATTEAERKIVGRKIVRIIWEDEIPNVSADVLALGIELDDGSRLMLWQERDTWAEFEYCHE